MLGVNLAGGEFGGSATPVYGTTYIYPTTQLDFGHSGGMAERVRPGLWQGDAAF